MYEISEIVNIIINDVYLNFHFIKNLIIKNNPENKSKVFERSYCTITVHNDLYYVIAQLLCIMIFIMNW